jgi:ornithine cyclodeaminase/alanine dehydrogenase-like protein (mu-crystallin family)
MMCRCVTGAEIAVAPLPLHEIYDLVLEGCRLHGLGEFELPPKQGLRTRPEAFMHAMPVFLPTKRLAGTKLVSVYPDNPAKGLPTTSGIIAMMGTESGLVTDIVDAAWITSMRTAMVSMVDTKFLANPDPVFGIVGATGASGRAHIEAIATIFPNSRILVNSRNRERCNSLVSAYDAAPCELIVQMDHGAVVKECDVLIVCTSTLTEPIFKAEWLHAGHNVLNVHARGWPPDILASVDRVSCDNRQQVIDLNNGLSGLYADLNPDFELGEVVVGNRLGRENATQKIFSFNYGLATFDILLADYLLSVL